MRTPKESQNSQPVDGGHLMEEEEQHLIISCVGSHDKVTCQSEIHIDETKLLFDLENIKITIF